MASLEGENKEKVNVLLRQLNDANSLIDEKERSIRASLEEKLSSLEETYAICVSKLRHDNELSLALSKTRENEKIELGIAHDRLVDSHEKLEKEFMSLK